MGLQLYTIWRIVCDKCGRAGPETNSEEQARLEAYDEGFDRESSIRGHPKFGPRYEDDGFYYYCSPGCMAEHEAAYQADYDRQHPPTDVNRAEAEGEGLPF